MTDVVETTSMSTSHLPVVFMQARFGLRFPRWANGLSESAKDLLRQLLGKSSSSFLVGGNWLVFTALVCLIEVDSANRYSAEQTLAHPWVTGARTFNKYLKSPNYLRTIKQEQVREKMNSRANGMPLPHGNDMEACPSNNLSISVRRQSR